MSCCARCSVRPAVLRIVARWAPSTPRRTLGAWRWCSTGGAGSDPLGGVSGSLPPPSQRPSTALAASVRDDLLRGVNADHREAVARIVEQAQRAADSWTTLYSDFHTPPIVADALMVLQRMADVGGVAWGGYAQAERCRVVVGREEMAAEADPSQLGGVAAVEVSGNFMFDPATHRDFLGACLGTGIDRDKVGDILVAGERGAQILVAPTLVEHLETALTQVRTVPVQTRAISLDSLQVRAPQVQELSSVEASMRLDAVASAGFRMSRSKMMELIKSGDVRVNWQSGAKPSFDVTPGDMISVSGKGRLEVKAANRTAKGKWSVQMVRYL